MFPPKPQVEREIMELIAIRPGRPDLAIVSRIHPSAAGAAASSAAARHSARAEVGFACKSDYFAIQREVGFLKHQFGPFMHPQFDVDAALSWNRTLLLQSVRSVPREAPGHSSPKYLTRS